jgi:hypothetical protein
MKKYLLTLWGCVLLFCVPVGVYFVLNPETFWQRFTAISIGVFLLGCEAVALGLCMSSQKKNGELDKKSSEL